ncbi:MULTISPECIES: hypothetical protein [Lactobacillaceae]|nr:MULTISPECIES: hypothetical protein [Lactobacillaceae]MCB7476445.1 hypothetical protein [Lactiplantibacillus plantarum]MCM2630051.1 hypothetical protein [Lactiplantibacillus plantarum]MDA5388692.1 hypothetical protein [Loigolactobacillus backii]MDA5391077.1 hypothetical protein [Loigolactobacillus backii]QTF55048.1 hypothetical protein J4Q33_15560 [Lactiplantibacillus plantarum]
MKQVDRSSESRRYKLPLGINLYLYLGWFRTVAPRTGRAVKQYESTGLLRKASDPNN